MSTNIHSPLPADETDLRAASDEIALQIGQIHRTLSQLRDLNNNEPRASFLLLLLLSQRGPLTAAELSPLVQSDPSTISRHIAALVKDGLILRAADQTDGRVSLLELTEKGRAACDELVAIRHRLFEQAMGGWTPSERVLFRDFLGRFSMGLQGALKRGGAYESKNE